MFRTHPSDRKKNVFKMAASSIASPENVLPLFKAAFRGDLKTVTQLLIPLPGGLTVHSVDKVHVEVCNFMLLSVVADDLHLDSDSHAVCMSFNTVGEHSIVCCRIRG